MAPKHSAESCLVFLRMRKLRSLTEKIHALDNLHSDTSYAAIGCEVHVNASTIYMNKVSLNRKTHRTRLYTDRFMDML